MLAVADNVWTVSFPLSLLGAQIGRTVTLIRLKSGDVVIHSTAPFRPETIRAVGRPGWLVDATLLHDTFARAGAAAFPELPYFAPDGFSRVAGVQTSPLNTPPAAWAGELEVLALEGMPKVREHVFLHRPSRTLIIADLVFNFDARAGFRTRFLLRWGSGIRRYPGVSRLFLLAIKERPAFLRSIGRMMQWDFDRLVVGHGEVIESGAKARLQLALEEAGLRTVS